MGIGEFARLTGLSPRRLRAYAASGLLLPSAVDAETGYRFYLPGQERAARLIDLLRTADVPIAEIASFLSRPSFDAIERWTGKLAAEVAHRMAALEAAKELFQPDTDSTQPIVLQKGRALITMNAAGATQTGAGRALNEDAFVAEATVAAVADGMGGHPGGARAARSAMGTVQDVPSLASADDLVAAISLANSRVWDEARRDPELVGMGTTMCAAAITDDGIAVANVGDSRCYLLRAGELTLVTTDHTVVAELLARGEIGEDDVAGHPHRHVLTRAIGVAPEVEADMTVVAPTDGDRLLLCTDGLADIAAERLYELLATGDPVTAVSRLLAEAASAALGDDVAVVVADVTVG